MTLHEDAPAKLNLALHVRLRRADGYHDLETIFAFTEFGDSLSATRADDTTLTVEGPFAPIIDTVDNLILRAASALRAASGVGNGAALHLVKRIPVAAGLGGGSADAAAALRLLNRLWRLDWPLARLAALGAALGADVPACVLGGMLLGEGRGEVLTPIDTMTLAGTPVLLVNPRVPMPTGPVFAGWDGHDRGRLDPAAALHVLRNDLQIPALAIAPIVGIVIDALERTGATLVRMSGSGATCLALFDTLEHRDSASVSIGLAYPDWWIAPTKLQ